MKRRFGSQGWARRHGPGYSVSVPSDWRDESPPVAGTGKMGLHIGDQHAVHVERVVNGWMPVVSLMADISVLSRRALTSYEPGDAEAVVVAGAMAARRRWTATVEGQGQSFMMLELFAEGLDDGMWYVRVAGDRPHFDDALADRIIRSFRVEFAKEYDGGQDPDR